MPNTVVVITGGFDPLHSGHLNYIKAARKLGDILVIGVNSDEWLARKKGRSFMPFEDRISIIQSLQGVDYTIPFNDKDNSAKDAIQWTRRVFPQDKIIFANGGDRNLNNILEMDIIDDNLEFVFGVGGEDKANSSSWILEEWKSPKTERQWGYYRVLHENGTEVKVKELTVEPRQSLSMQRHNNRLELWFVAEGTASNNWEFGSASIKPYKTEIINPMEWHQLHNSTEQPLKVIEIQYGDQCEEEDIERK